MNIDVGRSILIIAVCAACTFAERLFPVRDIPRARGAGGRALSGKILPTAIIATLTVYCLRGASFGDLGGFAPSLIAVAVTVAPPLEAQHAYKCRWRHGLLYLCCAPGFLRN